MSQAFSNGTEWDAWSAGWCNRCTKTSTCTILDELFLGEGTIPEQWIPGPLALSPERYTCTAFDAEAR